MARVAVLGERVVVQGYGLAGAIVRVAEDDAAVRSAWQDLPEDVDVVLLTATAARALGDERTASLRRLTVVIPQ